jgi:hypothetical protein
MTNSAKDTAYAVNKRIVADDFGEETVLINVEKGLYFSMQGSATEIWRAFDAPQYRSQAVSTMSRDLSAADHHAIDAIVQSMIEHDLLVEAEVEGDAGGQAKLFSFAATAFTAPVLGVFSDLAELIAIDPVHEVDENAGWPVRPPSFPPTA